MTDTCPRCALPVGPDDKFCESCGAGLQEPAAPLEQRAGTALAKTHAVRSPCPECGATSAHGVEYCPDCGTLQPDGTDHFDADLGTVVLISDVGLVHSRNEDGVAAGVSGGPGANGRGNGVSGGPGTNISGPGAGTGNDPAAGATPDVHRGVAAVVCDGISSVSRPQEASAAAVEAALDELLAGLNPGTATEKSHLAATASAVRAVAALDTQGEADPPACTYVAATVTDTPNGPPELAVSWIGDSRAYWLSRTLGQSLRLTEDDSWAGEMVRAGLLDEATAAAHPHAHAITRWIGADTIEDAKLMRPHFSARPVEHPGVALVCSDGLWNYLPDAQQLAEVVFGAPTLIDAARALNTRALTAGGEDNITIVLIEISLRDRSTG